MTSNISEPIHPNYLVRAGIRYTIQDAGSLELDTEFSNWWYKVNKGLIALYPNVFQQGSLKPEHDSDLEINHMLIEIVKGCMRDSKTLSKAEKFEIEKGLIRRRTSYKWIHHYLTSLFFNEVNSSEKLLKSLTTFDLNPDTGYVLPALMNIIDPIFDKYGGLKNMTAEIKHEVSAKVYKSMTLNEKSKWLSDIAYHCYLERKNISDFYRIVKQRYVKR